MAEQQRQVDNTAPGAREPQPIRESQPERSIRDRISDATHDAKDKARQAAKKMEARAESTAAENKGRAADRVDGIAEAARTGSQTLRDRDQESAADVADAVADRAGAASRYLRDHEVGEMRADAERFARRNPWVFLGGSFVAGVLIGRFLRASSDEEESHD